MSTIKCRVTLYYDTGLSRRVTLLWAQELNEWPNKVSLEDVYFTRDTIYKGSIRLNQPVGKVERADIIKIHVWDAVSSYEDYYYDVLSVNGLSADTTEVQIQLDPILSLGGAGKIKFAYGHITRGHTYKDRVTLSPEPYIFSDNLKKYESARVWPAKSLSDLNDVGPSDGVIHLIVSSVALDQMDVDGVNAPDVNPARWFFGNKEVGYNLNRLRIPQINEPTNFFTYNVDTDIARFVALGKLKAFERTPYTRASLEYLVSLAYDDPVFSEYDIPSDYITIEKKSNSKGAIDQIDGNVLRCETGSNEANNIPSSLRNFCAEGIATKAQVKPKNSKVLKCYSAIVANAMATGQMVIYSGADLESWEQGRNPKIGVRFIVWCDPSPGGRNYLTFQGVANSGGFMTHSVVGEGWQKPTVKTENSFGYTMAQRQINAEIFSRFCDVVGALALTAGLGAVGGLGSAAGGAALNAEATGTALSFGERTFLSGAQGLGNLATSQGTKKLASSQIIQGVKSGGSIPGAYARMQDLQNRNFGTVMQVGNNNGFAIASANTFELNLYAPSATDIKQLDYMFNTYGYTQYTDVVQLQDYLGGDGYVVFALRPNFTYLQIPDCVIRNGKGKSNTRNVMALAEEQFKSGVFIHRKVPELGKEAELIKSNYYGG